jgi:hypothetical protein
MQNLCVEKTWSENIVPDVGYVRYTAGYLVAGGEVSEDKGGQL